MMRSFATSILLMTLFFAASTISMVSAVDLALRQRLRRKAEAVDAAIHQQYLDLADLVTNGFALQLVEERREQQRRRRRERKMIVIDDFDSMPDDLRLYGLYGMSVNPDPPTLSPTTAVVVEPPMSMSMSMPLLSDQPADGMSPKIKPTK